MRRASSTTGVAKVDVDHKIGASDGALPLRPARMALLSMFQSSAGIGHLPIVEELAYEQAHLVVLEQERVMAVGAVDLGVPGVHPVVAQARGQVALLVR